MSTGKTFRRFHIGPGAASLIMILIVLSMSALGILALVSSRGDYSLSMRSAAVAEQIYQLNESAENRLADLDGILVQALSAASDDASYLAGVRAALPEDMSMEDRTIRWEERNDANRVLSCAIMLETYGSENRFRWVDHALYYDYDEMEYDDSWN